MSDLTGSTVTDHYFTVLHGYGHGDKLTHRDAIVAAMEQSRDISERYDLVNSSVDREIADRACVVTVEERAMFRHADGTGGIERPIDRETFSWLRPHNRTQYDAIVAGAKVV